MTSIIQANNLTKRFGSKRALNNVTAEIEAGLPIGLVGPNGAGKTTFFSIICGYLQPTSGEISVFGESPMDPSLKGRLGVLPQDARLTKGIAVAKQLRMLAELQGLDRGTARSEAARVLELVGLSDAAKQPAENLSHGMYKRVTIAQAFIGSPELIILDEPTSGLDPDTAEHMRNLIHTEKMERTFLISSHNLHDIEDLCQRVLILKNGELTHYDAVDQLIGRANIISVRLEQAPTERIREIFKGVEGITHIEISEAGDHRLTLHIAENNRTDIEITILQCLAKAGVQYRELSRGESLARTVSNITKS